MCAYSPYPAQTQWLHHIIRARSRSVRRFVRMRCPNCGHVNVIDLHQPVYVDSSLDRGQTIRCKKCGHIIKRASG